MFQNARSMRMGRGAVHIDVGNDYRQSMSGMSRRTAHSGDSARPQNGRPFMMSSNVTVNNTRREYQESGFWVALRAVRRAIVATLVLLTALFAIALYADTALPLNIYLPFLDTLIPATPWFNAALALVPVTFLAINLVNRRYGPGLVIVQVFLAWAIAVGAVLLGTEHLQVRIVLPPQRETIAFAAALFTAHLLALAVFDRTRCIRWWQAPLLSSIWGSMMFALIFYPAAYAGSTAPWFAYLAIHAALMLAASVLLLVPYWALRPAIRPLRGFAGY